MRRALMAMWVLSCAAVVSACGGSDSGGDPSTGPKAVAVAWSKAVDSGDGEKACSLMTPASVRWVEQPLKPIPGTPLPGMRKPIAGRPSRPCAKLMSHGIAPDLPATSARIQNGRAVVPMKESDQLIPRVVLFRMDGRWRVDFARTWGHPFGTD